jgi:hypothetical protein
VHGVGDSGIDHGMGEVVLHQVQTALLLGRVVLCVFHARPRTQPLRGLGPGPVQRRAPAELRFQPKSDMLLETCEEFNSNITSEGYR